jgi:hypothetical protein
MAKHMAGIQTFKKGHIWRIGDASSINVWEDKWIPSSHSRKVLTPEGQNLLTRGNEPIDPHTNSWDADLVTEAF